jgi:succinoglycan biosynthesis protein ExoM
VFSTARNEMSRQAVDRATAGNVEHETALFDRISVCICTFQRPVLLARLLASLQEQRTDGRFTYEVIVVDNSPDRSAEFVVNDVARTSQLAVLYDHEPQRNISLTRNRAVRNASGALIAFIDDDERPVGDWLYLLHETLAQTRADVVLAPVLPEFPPDAPSWLTKSRVLYRRRHQTGSRVGTNDARTGNVLIRRELFADGECWFDPSFGRTGGEDTDFFLRQARKGHVFVWCDEAVAHEFVPPERWKASFHLKRYWRSGTSSGEWIRSGKLPRRELVTNVLAAGVYATAMVPALLLPKHLSMRVAQKLAYCGGVITAFLGFSLLRDRD